MRLSFLKPNLSLLCIGIFIFSLFCHSWVPFYSKAFLYSLSLTFKELLLFALPAVIFSFVFNSMNQMRDRALSFLLILLPMICLSNFISTNLAYTFGRFILSPQAQNLPLASNIETLAPLWQMNLPHWISNDMALGGGVLLGLVISFLKPDVGGQCSRFLMNFTSFLLKKLLLPVMPLFILGFSMKLAHDQVLGIICQHYLKIFLILLCLLVSYLSLIYGFAVKFRPSQWISALRHMAPAAITGLSTMSSAASLPLMILGAEKNVAHPEIVRGVVPAVVNIHLIGDCFAIPLFAIALMASFGFGVPSYETYFIFALYFVLAKFAVAAVPGGGILVMLPILEKYLGFTPEMLSLITILYMTFDPVITSANVLGNGVFAMIFSRLFARLKSTSKEILPDEASPLKKVS